MKQAVVTGPGIIEYRDVPRPDVTLDSVLVRVSRIGICGSDVHVFTGKHPLVSFPLVQGHEFSGYVQETGKNVTGFKTGDLVTVLPAIGCGDCPRCREGLIAQCDNLQFIGGALTGAGGEYILVPQQQVIKIPAGIDADDAAMIEPLAVAVHAAELAGDIGDKNVLIVGGGTIGNLIAQAVRLAGPKKVVVMEKIPFRREVLSGLGFVTLSVGQDGAVESVREVLGGADPDTAFECVGSGRAVDTCIRAVRRGGEIVVVGVYGSPPEVQMVLVQDKELVLRGSLMYTRTDYQSAVGLMAEKKVNLKVLQTHHVSFDRWAQGYDLLLHNPANVLKVLVDL